jgi:hypothetical protein
LPRPGRKIYAPSRRGESGGGAAISRITPPIIHPGREPKLLRVVEVVAIAQTSRRFEIGTRIHEATRAHRFVFRPRWNKDTPRSHRTPLSLSHHVSPSLVYCYFSVLKRIARSRDIHGFTCERSDAGNNTRTSKRTRVPPDDKIEKLPTLNSRLPRNFG